MSGSDVHDEQRYMFRERLEAVYAKFPDNSLVLRRANGIKQACNALGDAIIDMVPEGEDQDDAITAVLDVLRASTHAFQINPPEEE